MSRKARPRIQRVQAETAELSEQLAEAKGHLDSSIVGIIDALITQAKSGNVPAGVALLRLVEDDIRGMSDRGGDVLDKVREIRRASAPD